MNLENQKSQKHTPIVQDDFELDFKPITSGLGFHHQKSTDVKPVVTERRPTPSSAPSTFLSPQKEMNIYQNDLSLFYGQPQTLEKPSLTSEFPAEETIQVRSATTSQRISAYLADLLLISSVLAIVLTVMARTIHMDLMDVWREFPHEITPLVLTLFCGFYLMYFAIFEKTAQSTLGKALFGLRVTDLTNKPLNLITLLMRSVVTLMNFISLGLFSYFDLHNKITSSKVVRIR